MGAAREKLQAEFDLERFIEMFDEALTSDDERVVNALRSLMMMVILTKSESPNQSALGRSGPLRQLYEDLHNLNRRLHDMDERVRSMESHVSYQRERAYAYDDHEKKYTMAAARNLAAQIDQDVLNQLSPEFFKRVNGGKI